jgi:TRAP-type C4-dicarboxylate transport system substrate-binding protein
MTAKLARTTLRSAMAFLSLGCAAALAQQPIAMKIGLGTINEPQHRFVEAFKAEVEKKTAGKVQVQVFPAGQLGAAPRQIEGLQLGTIEGFQSPSAFLKGVDPVFEITEAPGIVLGYDHAAATYADAKFRDAFLNHGKAKGVIGIAIWPHSPTSLLTVAPMRTLADMRGRKIRVLATKIEQAIMAEFGATGVPIPFEELMPALQSRTVDGLRSSMVVTAAMKYYTVTKFVVPINDTMTATGLWVSTAFWDKLPADLRKTLADTGQGLEKTGVEMGRKALESAEKTWTDNGGEVTKWSAAEVAEFLRRVQPHAEEVFGKSPDAGTREVWAVFKDAAARTRR